VTGPRHQADRAGRLLLENSIATALGAAHRLRAADAVHLATAVAAGADRFLTDNQADFPKSISEIDITYPQDLPDPTTG
jgi:hypothetical protein